MKRHSWNKLLVGAFLCLPFACAKKTGGGNTDGGSVTPPIVTGTSDVAFWLTSGDQSSLLQKQKVALNFDTLANGNAFIDVDSTQVFQTIDGFGFALTGGSAFVINQMSAAAKTSLLQELFGSDSADLGISYLRVSIGASDMSPSVFSYDDMPPGQTDTALKSFDLNAGDVDVVPLLQQILAINPRIKILACPWSAPAWMKTNDNASGGSLLPQYYGAYSGYMVRYIQSMQAQGIRIDAITPQNEPLNANNNPAMVETAVQEDTLVRFYLGPAFATAGLTTKIIVYDHNCDQPQYPETILADAGAYPYVDGSAFHLYAGDISALSAVHTAFPQKNLYFTEMYTASTGVFGTDLDWHLKNVIIGATRNWSRNALEWNLATNASYGPNTPGGCTTCQGALTIEGSVTRNVSYYIIGHASRFVPPGSVRIASDITGNLNNVAFQTPSGKKVLIVENDGSAPAAFNIRFNGKWVATGLAAGAVGTFVW